MTIECPKCQQKNLDDSAFCAKCGTKIDADIGPTKTIETSIEELKRGTVFAGRYEIIEELGKGGMGRVYRVEDIKVKEEIALKHIKPEIAADKKTIERFRNELKIARKIRHKNVCAMFDLSEEKGSHFITMEYVSGGDLKKFIRRSGQLSVGKAISIAKQICDGLEEAHGLGIVHRDLKPNNIMIDDNGNARIMDFGIARTLKEKGITGSGVMIGTPEYMSPEQVEAKEVDQRSDIYSLGIIMYEMLTGRLPFEADTPFAVGIKQKSEIPKSPKEYNSQISDDLNRVILKCLEKDKENRYKDAVEVKSELEKIEQGLPTSDRVVPPKKTLTSREITVHFSMKKIYIPASIVIALAVIAMVIWSPWKQKVTAPILSEKPSVAVLPFEDLSRQGDQRDLCDGIPETLIVKLNRLENIYVPGPDSSFFFRDNIDLIEIGARLKVNSVLTGSIQTDGNRVRIRPRLIKIADGSLIWTEQYDSEQTDIFDIQDAIALKIIEVLKVKLLGEEKADVFKRYTDSSEAYYLYLKGRNFWNLRTAKGLTTALDYFDQAIKADKDYALAFSGVADCHLLLPWYGSLSHKDEYPKAREAAQNAVKIDDSLAEAHTSLAGVKYWNDWDWEGAIEELERAIELNPNYETAHHWYGEVLSTIGKQNEAVEELRIAFELDPLSIVINSNLGINLFYARRYDEAIEQFEQTLQLNPEYGSSLRGLGQAYFMTGMFNEALECFGTQSLTKTFVYTAIGREEEALKLLEDIEKQYSEGEVNPLLTVYIAEGYLGVENRDMAFKYLDIAYKDRNPRLLDFFRNPIYHDRLKSDPRYITLLKNMKLSVLIE